MQQQQQQEGRGIPSLDGPGALLSGPGQQQQQGVVEPLSGEEIAELDTLLQGFERSAAALAADQKKRKAAGNGALWGWGGGGGGGAGNIDIGESVGGVFWSCALACVNSRCDRSMRVVQA
jgi:hypothetical protein